MKRKSQRKPPPVSTKATERRRAPSNRVWSTRNILNLCGMAAGVALGLIYWVKRDHSPRPPAFVARPAGTLTFNKDIAPIVFKHCGNCHRPGQSGPFHLLTYEDVKKHGRDIARVTGQRVMPPWLPEPGYGDFADPRILSVDQIGMIEQWFREGSLEGNASDLPPVPQWTDGWQLGKPDLVVAMPEAYTLAPDGKDFYRNFVVPIPLSARRYVQGIEFRPSNGSVHHAFIRFDRTQRSRRLDAQETGPGFSGMQTPNSAQGSDGYFLGWQPGKMSSKEKEGFSWPLDPGTDLVLQLHLRPTGKSEPIQASLGFYFTEKPPERRPFKIGLSSHRIDIPAGETNYVVKDAYALPVDVEILALAPHAHYLAKELQVFATLPDGGKEWLLRIKEWNFDWQGDYRYAKPVSLPKGSILSMEYRYDNSTNNVRNPHHPPQRVRYGVQSTDEMGEVYLQVSPRTSNDFEALASHYQHKVLADVLAFNQYLLQSNPRDPKAHNELGKVMLVQDKRSEAFKHFHLALLAQPDYDEPHYHLGLILEQQGKGAQAKAEYETALRINPENFEAHNNLGLLLLGAGRLAEAQMHFEEVIRINPNDTIARENLKLVLQKKE